MEIIVWLAFCVLIGYYAATKNRSAVLWGLLAFIFSPLLMGVILALMKDKRLEKDMSKMAMEHQQLRDRVATDEKVNEMRFNHLENSLPSGQVRNDLPEPTVKALESNYKFCPYCHKTIKQDAIKCRYCHQMLTELQTEPCPYCKEDILVTATVCPHCDSVIERPQQPEVEKAVTDDVDKAGF